MTTLQRLNSILNLTFKTGQMFYLTDVYLVALPIFKFTNPNNNTLESLIRRTLEELEENGKLDYVDDDGNKIVRKNGNGCYRLK